MRGALELARTRGELDMDAEARAAWPALYDELSAGRDDLIGAVTGRAEAQVRRLAALYALLDSAPIVGIAHLRAAVAVWDYCYASAAHVFGAKLGDEIADRLGEALDSAGREGLTRSEVRDLLGGRISAQRIETAFGRLEARGIAERSYEPTGGGPVERWTLNRGEKPPEVEQSDAEGPSLHDTPLSSTAETPAFEPATIEQEALIARLRDGVA